jgi:DNA-binding beta-propeller fold protein YncE
MVASQIDNWIRVIDLQQLKMPEKILTGIKPHPGPGAIWNDLAFSAVIGEGNVTVWNYTSWEVVKYIPTDGPGLFVRSYRYGETVYPYVWVDVFFGANNASVHVIDARTLSVVKTLKPGLKSLHPEFTYDGKFVYVSVWDENKVVVYDANTLEVVTEIVGLETPTGIFNVGLRLEEPGA